jgi:hypothetical protein
VEYAAFERRWQMLLGCLGEEDAPFSQGSLYNFRMRLIGNDMDRRLLDRTVALAQRTQAFGSRSLRAAFDASPLFGAGRVEDTFNLIGHAARDLLKSVAARLGVDEMQAAQRAGIPVLTGSSLKATLDIDWDDASAKQQALQRLLGQVRSLEHFIEGELAEHASQPPLSEQLSTLREIIDQDTEPEPDGSGPRIKQGVAKERRISVRDPAMRHGRKSKQTRVDGYKRHIALDLDSKVILAAAITPANRPEAEATGDLLTDIEHHGELKQLHIDRGYLGSPLVAQQRAEGVEVLCKPYPLRNGGRYTKADFTIDLANNTVTCPQAQTVSIKLGCVARFPAQACAGCPERQRCTRAKHSGRSLSIHAQEDMHMELRTRRADPEGRAGLRERVFVEHGLAAISRSQGRRARYIGQRKNLFDVRRHAAVNNLHIAARAA